MKLAVILFLLGLGVLFLVRGGVPGDWLDAGGGAPVSGPVGSPGGLGRAIGGALQRAADQF